MRNTIIISEVFTWVCLFGLFIAGCLELEVLIKVFAGLVVLGIAVWGIADHVEDNSK